MEVKVEGLGNLLKTIDNLGGNIKQSKQKALLRAGAVFEASAKEHCPVDTGNLRDSIHTEAKDDETVSVETNADYAVYVEYGTGPKGDPSVPHTTKKFWRYQDEDGNWITSHGQAPQPFMRQAFAEGKDAAVNAAAESVKEDVRGLAK